MSDTFDKSSTLKIDGEVLNRSSFGKNASEKLYRRVGNDITDPLYVFQLTSNGSVPLLEYGSVSSLASGSLTDIISYTVPVGKTLTLEKVEVSGANIAKYQVEFDSVVKGVRRTYWGNFNSDFEFKNIELAAGTVVKVRVIHTRPLVADFDATLLGALA